MHLFKVNKKRTRIASVDIVLVSFLLILDRFSTVIYYFYCKRWTGIALLETSSVVVDQVLLLRTSVSVTFSSRQLHVHSWQ